jgi:hypothetical protein
MPATYEPITTQTLGSNQNIITFTNFGGYTDLVLIINAVTDHGDNGARGYIKFNSDSNTNYSVTYLASDGSAPLSSFREASQTYIAYGVMGNVSTNYSAQIINIMNYTNTNVFKSVLCRSANADGTNNSNRLVAGNWRSTAAITQIDLDCDGEYITGSTFTLYGILKA